MRMMNLSATSTLLVTLLFVAAAVLALVAPAQNAVTPTSVEMTDTLPALDARDQIVAGKGNTDLRIHKRGIAPLCGSTAGGRRCWDTGSLHDPLPSIDDTTLAVPGSWGTQRTKKLT